MSKHLNVRPILVGFWISAVVFGIFSLQPLLADEAKVDGSGITSTDGVRTEGVVTPNKDGSGSSFFSRRAVGKYFGFGLAKPNDIGTSNQFKSLYGSPSNAFVFQAGVGLLSYGIDLGVGTSVAYSKHRGNPLIKSGGFALPTSQDLDDTATQALNQELELTLIPVQIRLDAALSPFQTRRVVLRGWYGLEQLYVQEVLQPSLPANVESSNKATYINKGWNSGKVIGVGLSVALNGIEPRSDYALKALGIDRTFITPFIEKATTTRARMGNFDRRSIGIAFSFESLK